MGWAVGEGTRRALQKITNGAGFSDVPPRDMNPREIAGCVRNEVNIDPFARTAQQIFGEKSVKLDNYMGEVAIWPYGEDTAPDQISTEEYGIEIRKSPEFDRALVKFTGSKWAELINIDALTQQFKSNLPGMMKMTQSQSLHFFNNIKTSFENNNPDFVASLS